MPNKLLRPITTIAMAALLAGCALSGNDVQSDVSTVGPAVSQHASGATILMVYKEPATELNIHPSAVDLKVKKLAVADLGTGGVEILNKHGREVGKISSGLIGPDGDWYDDKGNLYVADYKQAEVQEYAPKSNKPAFTYSAKLVDPVAVTVDPGGNVFVADYDDGGKSGSITEYSQDSNMAANQCFLDGPAEGVAVDKAGDVFASYNGSAGGTLVEFKGGMQGCNATVLGASLKSAGGLILDKKSDLVACDQTAAVIDIIAPPYSSVTSTIAGFTDPFHVALNAKNTLLFVADPSIGEVIVDKYPTGASYTKLGASNGISDPTGVAAR